MLKIVVFIYTKYLCMEGGRIRWGRGMINHWSAPDYLRFDARFSASRGPRDLRCPSFAEILHLELNQCFGIYVQKTMLVCRRSIRNARIRIKDGIYNAY